jgi:GT2 family glycosyltransferase
LGSTESSLGVVIPCHDNSFQLSGVLRSLAAQTTRPEKVVVVDDNSNADEEVLLRRLCETHSAMYHRLPPPQTCSEALGRRSHARNAGSRRLDTNLILYLDGDILLGPGYLEEIRRYHARLGRVYLRGLRYSIPATEQRRGMDSCLDEIRRLDWKANIAHIGYAMPPSDYKRKRACGLAYYDRWEWCAGNNLSVRRKYASDVGLWDENFFGWGEEDIDFSYRLYQHGLVPIFLAGRNAFCYHLDHPVDHERNASTLRANARYLLRKFPQIAEHRRQAYSLFNIDIEALLIGANPSLIASDRADGD